MKSKLFKIIGMSLVGFVGLLFVCFAIYVILFYPRKAESFEIIAANPTKKILIATQGSDFKNTLTKILCDSLKKEHIYIRGIDVRDLAEVNHEDWDRILIINSFIIQLNKNVDGIISSTHAPEKILLFVTSGGADWQPPSQFKVDALTSASKKVYINDLVHIINNWMAKENDQKWEPDDYLLALRYIPQVDVKTACETIALEQQRYQSLYPNLVELINRIGYQYLRLNDVSSALKVFRLNISLFPHSWNVYDSYGEALLANGNRKSAIRNYQKALELNPESKSANEKLKKLGKE